MHHIPSLLRGVAACLVVAVAAGPAAAKPASSVPQLEAALHAVKTDRGLRIVLPTDDLFGATRDKLDADANPLLAQLAELMAATRPREVVIAGHTDSTGKDDDNQMLAVERARAVAAWLETHAGRPRPHFVAQGYGRTRPLAPNHNADGSDNPDGRARNRRIEITLSR